MRTQAGHSPRQAARGRGGGALGDGGCGRGRPSRPGAAPHVTQRQQEAAGKTSAGHSVQLRGQDAAPHPAPRSPPRARSGRAAEAGPARRPIGAAGRPALTCGPVVGAKALEPVKTSGAETRPRDAVSPPVSRDKSVLSAFEPWHCPLLGLLLGMCAPGGCGPRALAGELGVLGSRGQLPAGSPSPLWELAWLGLASQVKPDAPTPPHPAPRSSQAHFANHYLMESHSFACLDPLHISCSACQMGLSGIGGVLLSMMWTDIWGGGVERKTSGDVSLSSSI